MANRTEYKYAIGSVLKTNACGEIEITHHAFIKGEKCYFYKCAVCGFLSHDYNKHITETNLTKGKGCSACYGRTVIVGVNDMWTTRPDVAKMLKDKCDGFKYTSNSNKKTDFVCNICMTEKICKINNVSTKGFKCDICSDGFSFPERVMSALLNELNVDYISQLNSSNLSWIKNNKRYDFGVFVNEKLIIIETHGDQHYNGGFKTDYIDVFENDRYKKKLAIDNGVEDENYIVIDCSISDFEYIKTNIVNSKISKIFDITNVCWNKVFEKATNSIFKESVGLYRNGVETALEISKILGVSKSTIQRILNNANDINLLYYDKHKYRRSLKPMTEKGMTVVNMYNRGIRIVDIEKELNVSHSCIIRYLKKAKTLNLCDYTPKQK